MCTICKIEKPESDFYKDIQKIDKLRSNCKLCKREMDRIRYLDLAKLEKKRACGRNYYKKRIKEQYTRHRDMANACRNARYRSDSEYRKKQIKAATQNKIKRLILNPAIRAIDNARSRVSTFLREQNNSKFSHTLGCSGAELIKYLENKFQPGMTWQNYGKEWHIDHIHPLSLAYREGPESFSKASKYTNLQPLWRKDHVIKTRKDVRDIRAKKSTK